MKKLEGFKIGDEVEIIKGLEPYYKGKTGRIYKIATWELERPKRVVVEYFISGFIFPFLASELKLIKKGVK